MKKYAWVTWERQPRNISMAELFDCDYYEFNYSGSRLSRYRRCVSETIKVFKKRYDVIFVQNPSIILSLIAVLLAKMYPSKVVIDAHNAGVRPKEGRGWWLQKLNHFILRNADKVIVTNESLADHLRPKNVDCFIMSDPLPKIPNTYNVEKNHVRNIFVICSWAEDEPIALYLDAAAEIKDVEFRFTGNFKKYFGDKHPPHSNVRLLGFVSEEDYVMYLRDADLVLDLTTRDDCLVCGAYESISANKTPVLTNSPCNKEVFGAAAILSSLDKNELVEKLRAGMRDPSPDFEAFKTEYANKMVDKKRQLLEQLTS